MCVLLSVMLNGWLHIWKQKAFIQYVLSGTTDTSLYYFACNYCETTPALQTPVGTDKVRVFHHSYTFMKNRSNCSKFAQGQLVEDLENQCD